MSRYRAVLAVPHVAALVASVLLTRAPIGINALALVLFLRAQTGSYALAGAVAGGLAAGSGIGAPVQGRLVDRLGARRVLVPVAVAHAALLGLLVLGGEAHAPAPVLVALGVAAGALLPPASSVLRSMWPGLLRERPELLQAAYAMDSVGIELLFILGPLVTALLAATVSPAAALAVSAVAVVAGALAFTAQPPTRAQLQGHAGKGRLAGALRSPGVLTLVLTSVPAGMGLGMCEVALPAFSQHHATAAGAGLLLAVWSVGSAAGGLLYGSLPRLPLHGAHLAVTWLLPVSLLPLAAAPSFAAMALLVLPAGMFIAPLLATRNELVGRVAPEDARTEAFTWPQTAFVGGIAIGSALAGAIVEASGPPTAFLVAAGIAALGAVVAVVRRSTVAGPRAYPV